MCPCTQLVPVFPTDKKYESDVPEVSIGRIWLTFEHQLGYILKIPSNDPAIEGVDRIDHSPNDWLNKLRLANRNKFPWFG